MGGRITLINSVLASLPLYFFSFFKAPKKVIKEMVKIQRNFLWGGGEEVKKMAWVRWSRLCLPKEKGGLGIRSMEVFNIALLGKWKWRIMVEKDNLWGRLLEELYGEGGIINLRSSSVWWKDLQTIDKCLPHCNNWFSDSVKLKMWNREETKFWWDCWCGLWPMAELFPQLVLLTEDVAGSVADFGVWEEDRWCWVLRWSHSLSEEEEQMVCELEEILQPLHPVKDQEDKWRWIESKTHSFTVKSAYDKLLENSDGAAVNAAECRQLKKFWCTACPSKYMVHGWRVLIDRLPTRQQLLRRGVILDQQAANCVFCSRFEEDSAHLFLNCSLSGQLWEEAYKWLGMNLVSCDNAWDHLEHNRSNYGGKQKKKIRFIAWVAIVWVIWLNRNRKIFKGEEPNVSLMLSHVKGLLWSWLSNRLGGNFSADLEEWNLNPSKCLDRL